MKTRGTIAQLERKPGTPVPLAFWLVTGTEKIPVESATDFNVADDDTVEVSGNTNSNGTLIAEAISKVSATPPAPFPWKLAVGVILALVAVYAAYRLLQPSANSTYTVHAIYCGVPRASVPVALSNGKGQSFPGTTTAQGDCTITKLAAGVYTLAVGTTTPRSISIDGKTAYPPVTIDTTGTAVCVHIPWPPKGQKIDPKMNEKMVKLPEETIRKLVKQK